jgi:hypothetical protein
MTEMIFAMVVCYQFFDGRGRDSCEVLTRYGYFQSHEECMARKRVILGENEIVHKDGFDITFTCKHKMVPRWED